MASAWPPVKLGHVTVNHDSRRVPVRERDRRPGPYPYYGASGVVDHVSEFLFEGLHLLIAEDGENLRSRQVPVAFLADGRFWVNNHAHVVTGNEHADTRFLCYVLAATDISGYITGSAIPKLSQQAMNAIEIPLPPLEVQAQSLACWARWTTRSMRTGGPACALERLARAIFKAWFVDFEPVKAKAAGATSFPGMLQPAFDSLPTRLVESELGTAPEGWTVATLRDIASFISGGTPSKQESGFWGGSFPWVSAKDMHDAIVVDSELRLTEAGRAAVRRTAPRHATLMVVRGMSLMTEVRIAWCAREVAFNQDLRAFVARDGASPEFLYLWLSSSRPDLMHMVDTASHGTGRILTDRLEAMAVAKPHGDCRREFTEQVRPLIALRESLMMESLKLAQLRDYLLPKLLSGEVRVAGTPPESTNADA